ncbi:hypothetical protein [Halobacterium bonnevillei]|uniref:Small CPxCG-related zinc finger protein n=1 Tax=Halobacterium bonnevillei TaxID=2692200 RepID=A0A6B0SX51_9EURY|nr:hypothetical protein [Halobacterium bonnevillei]MXR22009.1 hypothetical protein [Halobacterium bonnevillei]
MNCAVCNQTGVVYRLVGEETLGLCEQCVAEHLTTDVDNETCLYCSEPGSYDLAEDTGAVPGTESPEEYEVVTAGVVCGDHVSTLKQEVS